MKFKDTLAALALTGFVAAQSTAGLVIPPDQPICRLYSIIQLLGTAGGVLLADPQFNMFANLHLYDTLPEAVEALLALYSN